MLKRKKTPIEEPESAAEESTYDVMEVEESENSGDFKNSESPEISEDPDIPDIPDIPEISTTSLPSEILLKAFESWKEGHSERPEVVEAVSPAVEMLVGLSAEEEFDPGIFDLLARGLDYERAVAEAEKTGEINGRNARIEELLATRHQDDGVPHPGISSGPVARQTPSIFDIARSACD